MLSINQKKVATGQIINNERTNINYSDIFSELIQAAGMGCEAYSSDLFYELTAIKTAIDALENTVFYIGIRTLGVDGESFISRRLNRKNCNYEPNCYIKIYRLKLIAMDDSMTMELERISEYTATRELVAE